MNYALSLNRYFNTITYSNKFMTYFRVHAPNIRNQLNNKDIVEFSKIKVNVEKEKIDKYVPNRYIPKIGDNGKMYKMLDVIAKDELKYLQYANIQHDKNHYFDESRCPKLNSIRANIVKQESLFKDMIFKGIKSDIETIGLYRHEPEKTNLKAINNAEIEEKLVGQALTDISNFTGLKNYIVQGKIETIYWINNNFSKNKNLIDKIGFWKGNFFGTKEEKQLYSLFKNENEHLENSINIIYDSIKDKIDETINISVLTCTGHNLDFVPKQTNFKDENFRDNAIAHANTQIELKNIIENEELNNNEIPQFLIDRDFLKNVNSGRIDTDNASDAINEFSYNEHIFS